jgi:hypothetical protein
MNIDNTLIRKWLNPETGEISDFLLPKFDYGISHCNNDGSCALAGMKIINSKKVYSQIYKESFIEKFGLFTNISSSEMMKVTTGGIHLWEAPSQENFINGIILLRRFLNADLEEKRFILISKLGFDDIGLSIGNKEKYSTQLTYKFQTEPTQIELWLSQDGSPMEINRFNNSKFVELKIPLTSDGLRYIFLQVITDMNKVNFNKFIPEKDTLKRYQMLINTNNYIPDIDDIPISELKSIKM